MDLNVKSVFNTIRLYVFCPGRSGNVALWLLDRGLRSLTAWTRFAPLLQKNATQEDPSRVIVTASIAGLGVGTLGEQATFGYSASKGIFLLLASTG